MQEFTPEGLRVMEDVARRHAVSLEAAVTIMRALALSNGTQAQFNHPDLGGMGQWSQGGMIMVGDMFNNALKHRVDQLCAELAGLLRNQPSLGLESARSQSQSQNGPGGVSLFVAGSGSGSRPWWPEELGIPASTGAQNDLRYACFPDTRRLAIERDRQTRVYDTGDHKITGFSQQQRGDQSLTFSSQFGLVRVDDLPLAAPLAEQAEGKPAAKPFAAAPETAPFISPGGSTTAPIEPPTRKVSVDDIFTTIERLADLRQKNILTEEEFAAKKSELLSRL
jgi:Short C-terminal domain